jgi:hypothetical protein
MALQILKRQGLRCNHCPQGWPLHVPHDPTQRDGPPNSVLTLEYSDGRMVALCRSHAIMAVGPRRVREVLGETEANT